MSLTQTEALSVVSLTTMKTELRIPLPDPADPGRGSEHDDLLAEQIHAAAAFVMESTGTALADLAPLRPAIVAAVRSQYDGAREITQKSAIHAWAAPFRSLAD